MNQPVLAYYGDDFTGSADVMEVLQWSGLRTVLFLDPPSTQQLEAFDNLRAFGVAGWGRTMSPSEMNERLRPVLQQLAGSGAPIVHYKTCSTFDSSATVGSIGRALELGRETFGRGPIPVVVGAPNLGRYQVFGNLFARSGIDSPPYRLDRHPTMQRHPITPMTEADLRRHLAQQTNLTTDLFDVLQLDQSDGALPSLDSSDADAVLFDVLNGDHLRRIGQVIQTAVDRSSPRLVVGSSGVEYALSAYWSAVDRLPSLQSHEAGHPTFSGVSQLLVITGTCSPVNDRQIGWAESHGFETLPLDPASLIDPATRDQTIRSSVLQALDHLEKGENLIIHSSRGPDDPRVDRTLATLRSMGWSSYDIQLRSGRTLGPLLGTILRDILRSHVPDRVAVAGGDTSGYVARALGITALEAIAPLAPGSPLCRAHADNKLDRLEIFFKGGQVGKDNVWQTTRLGTQ